MMAVIEMVENTLDARVARLKSDVSSVRTDIADIKANLRQLRGELAEIRAELSEQFRRLVTLTLATVVTVVFAVRWG